MNIVFIADPIETFVIKKDTTHALMHECQARNYTVYHALPNAISINDGRLIISSQKCELTADSIQGSSEKTLLQENEINAIFIRNDPPFDDEYLCNTWLLSHFKNRIPILNDPDGIRTVNEKIWVSQYTDITPKTLISSSKAILLEQVKHLKQCIIKPLNGYGGSQIFILKDDDPNKNVILESVTQNFSKAVILQEYLSDAKIGDKRVLVLNGEILGATLRVHNSTDHRNNFFAGGHAEKCDITPKEREIILKIKDKLKQLGLYFVGLDFIGEKLIEVNVTSPTCLKEINTLNNVRLEENVIDFMESLTN